MQQGAPQWLETPGSFSAAADLSRCARAAGSRSTGRHRQGNGIGRETRCLQKGAPLGGAPGRVRLGKTAGKLQELGQQSLLPVGQLQALGHRQRIGRASQERGRQGHTEAPCPVQPAAALAVALEPLIEQGQASPGLEGCKGLGPRLTSQQEFELHAQAGGEGGRG